MKLAVVIALCVVAGARQVPAGETGAISSERMEAIYEEVKTPFKYGVVIEPPPGRMVDCPNVFRHGRKWFMVYIQLEQDPVGYSTQLAESDDLLHWRPRGTVLARGQSNAWDQANAAGGVALFDTRWGGSNRLQMFGGRYWLSYLGGAKPGYETPPLSICVAWSRDPSRVEGWERLPMPVLRPDDPDARPFERDTLFKSHVFRDRNKTLGAPFVMFYNARAPRDSERIGIAVSHDMKSWKRHGDAHVLENARPEALRHGVISGDPQITRMEGVWVMFYFGAFWKPGAFDTFAASRDLVHWTKWEGPDLIRSSEPWDARFAHKPWLLKHDGVVYHFYCAVDENDHRTIALATSREVRDRRGADGRRE